MTLIDTLLARARAMEIPLFIKAPFAFNIQHDVQVEILETLNLLLHI